MKIRLLFQSVVEGFRRKAGIKRKLPKRPVYVAPMSMKEVAKRAVEVADEPPFFEILDDMGYKPKK